MSNTPTLMQSEEARAPWNEKKTKTVNVVVSQMLSCETTIEVPEDFEYDPVELAQYAHEQVVLPSEVMLKHSKESWAVDDFCVM